MEKKKKVEVLEKEIQEIKLKLTNLEEELKNAVTLINNNKINFEEELKKVVTLINNNKNNNDHDPVSSTKVPTRSNDNNKSSKDSAHTTTQPVNINNPKVENIKNLLSEINVTLEKNKNKICLERNKNEICPDETKKKENLNENLITESWVGKILMGTLASLLVFIAFIIFAKALLPYLTDTIKIILMFFFSIMLSGIGYIFGKKNPENTLFKALLACGSACIYLSILMTGIYFKAINSISMYILIALWATLIIFFKNDKDDWLFFSIGNLGYFVSIIITPRLNNEFLIIPGLIYVIMISVIYQFIYWENEKLRYIQNIINNISLLLFQIGMMGIFKKNTDNNIVGIVVMAFAFINFMLFTFSDFFKFKIENFYISVINVIAYFVGFFILDINFKNLNKNLIDDIYFMVIIIPAIVLEITNMYWRSKKISNDEYLVNAVYNSFFSGFLFCISSMVITKTNSWCSFLFDSGIILIVYSLIVVYGIIKKDLFFKIQGIVLVFVCIVIEQEIFSNLSFIIVAGILILLYFIVECYVLNNSGIFKIISYISLLGWILRIVIFIYDKNLIFIDLEILKMITYGIIAFINLVMILTKFYEIKNRKEEKANINSSFDDLEEEETFIHFILDVFNIGLLIFGVGFMNTMYTMKKHILKTMYLVIVFVLSCVNLPVKEKGNSNRYLYASIKFAGILWSSLCIYNISNYVISVYMITYAVVCIVFGFRNKLIGKPLRIFGLIMTLLFIIKFIIIDINFNNSVMKALSYLISGILCFTISAIYNHFEGNHYKLE